MNEFLIGIEITSSSARNKALEGIQSQHLTQNEST